jgi:hypothetical protein
MPIDCNAFCNNDSQRKINILLLEKNEFQIDKIQNEAILHRLCMIDCERRNSDAERDSTSNDHKHYDEYDAPLYTHRSGGNRKKYTGKTKNRRSRTRQRVRHRRPHTQMNHRKKTARK